MKFTKYLMLLLALNSFTVYLQADQCNNPHCKCENCKCENCQCND